MTIRVIATGSTREERADGNWGLSLLVGDNLLFDTYGVPAIFQRRLQEEGIDISAIRDIVVSHDHWDHTCGLWSIMLRAKGCRVHVCPRASGALVQNIELFGGTVSACGGFHPIRDGWVSTGEMAAAYNGNTLYEQALVRMSAMGPVVVTGCAHPGIVSILEKVRHWSGSPIYLVLGGFHLLNSTDAEILKIIDRMQELGVANVAPTHCTGERATELLRERFGSRFVAIRNGTHVEIPE